MKEQIPQPAPLSRTLQGKTREANTASVTHVLQAYKNDIVQRQEVDELLQGKFETAQREELEDDELLQGKFETTQRAELEDDELLQGKFEPAQRDELDDDELLQGKFETTQRQEAPNNTGMPDTLKAGVEQLSGLDMSDVKVHYNSSKPASVQAYAYTQGTDIHVATGQEKHLGHEAWHVAQQKQGRVQPTTTVAGMPVNDNAGLESEADVMGGKAVQMKSKENKSEVVANSVSQNFSKINSISQFVDNESKPFQLMKSNLRSIYKNDPNLRNLKVKLNEFTGNLKGTTAFHHKIPIANIEKMGPEYAYLATDEANVTYGTIPENRSDDPGNYFDPNYQINNDGAVVMTPRSQLLNDINKYSNPSDFKDKLHKLHKSAGNSVITKWEKDKTDTTKEKKFGSKTKLVFK